MAMIREQLKTFKKERIVEEAVRLFYERGFRGTSLEAIADSLDMTKPFIYGVYEKKTDILFDIATRITQDSLEAVEEQVRGDGTPRERLVRMSQALARICMDDRISVAVFFREEAQLEPERLAVVHETKGRIDDAIARLLDEGMRAGEFDVPDLRLAALAIGGMISWTYSWYQPAGRLSAEEIGRHMADYALSIAGASSNPVPVHG